jgi:hypothetical protein
VESNIKSVNNMHIQNLKTFQNVRKFSIKSDMIHWGPPIKHVRFYEHSFNFLKIYCISYVNIVSTFCIYPHIAITYFIVELCVFFRVCFLATLKLEILA